MKKIISILVVLIVFLSGIAASVGVFSNYVPNNFVDVFTSIHGKDIDLYGKGIYQYESISIASQAIAQDIITLVIGLPLLIISLYLFRKDSVRGQLLLMGTLGYFLYAYTSYTFLSMYNSLFLVYVAIMSLCFYTFTLTFMSIDVLGIKSSFKDSFPIKLISYFLFVIGGFMGLMWLGMIINPLINNTFPEVLEHYTTLVIQGLDLAFIIPTAFLSGILLLKKHPFGFVLAPIIIIKGVTLLTAMTAMVINELLNGGSVSVAFIVMVPIFNLLAIYILYLVLSNIKDVKQPLKEKIAYD